IKAQLGFVLKAKSFVLGIPYSCTSPQLNLRLSKLKFPVSDPQPHPVTTLTLVGAGDTIDFAHRASLTCALAHSFPLTSPISPLSARPRLLATAHTHTRTCSHTHASAHTHTHTDRDEEANAPSSVLLKQRTSFHNSTLCLARFCYSSVLWLYLILYYYQSPFVT